MRFVPASLPRFIRRYRRQAAAACAALCVLLVISALRPPAAETLATTEAPAMQSDEIGIPIALANPALAQTLRTGDVLDILTQFGSNTSVIAERARVMSTTEGGVLLIAVQKSQAAAFDRLAIDAPIVVRVHPPSLP